MRIRRYLGKQLMKYAVLRVFTTRQAPRESVIQRVHSTVGPALLPTIHPYGGTIRKVLCLLNQAWLVALHLTMSYLNVEQDASCFTGEGNPYVQFIDS